MLRDLGEVYLLRQKWLGRVTRRREEGYALGEATGVTAEAATSEN